jgi:uncharacterized protein (DUF342 family)
MPPKNDGKPITPDYILETLQQNNIVFGVQHANIHEAYETCVNKSESVTNVLVAKGEAPSDEVQEYLQLNPYLGVKDDRKGGDHSVDHRARSAFIIVKKDQALAKLRQRKPGKEGSNVYGETLPFKVLKPTGVMAGENTRMEGGLLLSNINGQLIQFKGAIHVKDSLVVKGPIGYTTGNIIFPGNVEIEGPVSDGFKIYSGGSVLIRQTFDVTDTVVKKDLIVVGGIIGRGEAMVKVGGSLRTKFVENCHVAARKSIMVDLEIINSRIFTLETLEMSEKGQIVGGEIHAVKGLRVGKIGKRTGRAARIHCGIDFTLEQEKEKSNNYLRVLAGKMSRLRELLNECRPDDSKRPKMEAILKKLAEEQQKAQTRVADLLGKLPSYENAVIEVKGEIAPGTLIEICKTALFVTEPLKKVRIRYGRESEKLITESL